MSSLNPFSKPKIPRAAQSQEPTEEERRRSISEAHKETKRRSFAQRGRGSTVLGGAVGDDSSGLATKALLGG